MNALHTPTAVGALRNIAAGGLHNNIAELGITLSDYELTRQDTPWRATDRPAVLKTLEALLAVAGSPIPRG